MLTDPFCFASDVAALTLTASSTSLNPPTILFRILSLKPLKGKLFTFFVDCIGARREEEEERTDGVVLARR